MVCVYGGWSVQTKVPRYKTITSSNSQNASLFSLNVNKFVIENEVYKLTWSTKI